MKSKEQYEAKTKGPGKFEGEHAGQMKKALLTKGSGYWDTTEYPLGGCFRRATQDMTVEVTGEKYEGKREFLFGDKRKGWTSVLMNPEGGGYL